MKVIFNKYIPFRGFAAINLFGAVFARMEYNPLSKTTLNHEVIHTAQMKEMLYVFFYVWYLVEWIIRLPFRFDAKEAYMKICFEREAYLNQGDILYLEKRKRFSFLKYVFL